jgi:hypothetical protein
VVIQVEEKEMVGLYLDLNLNPVHLLYVMKILQQKDVEILV